MFGVSPLPEETRPEDDDIRRRRRMSRYANSTLAVISCLLNGNLRSRDLYVVVTHATPRADNVTATPLQHYKSCHTLDV